LQGHYELALAGVRITSMFPLRRDVFEEFAITAQTEPAGSVLPDHRHDRAILFMVFEGVVFDESERGSRAVRPGELLLCPPRMSHANHYGEQGASLVWIDVMPALMETVEPLYEGLWADARLTFNNVRRLPELIFDEMRAPDAASRRILPGLVEQLLGLGARSLMDKVRPDWLRRALELLDASYRRKVDVTAIARQSGVSPSRLHHGFRDYMGRSIGDYVRELRVEAAASELRNGCESVGVIASSCGFADQAHLTRTFRELRGVTPAHYRRMNRTGAAATNR